MRHTNRLWPSLILACAVSGTACAQNAPPPDTQIEYSVDADSVAGAIKAVTGTVEQIDIPADGIAQRDVHVWLPSSYADNSDRRYPVLYMHDGQNVFDPETSYIGWDWGVDEALSALSIEVIVVAVENIPRVRLLDYFPEKAADTHADAIAKHFPGFDRKTLTGDAYLRHLVDAVKPAIDARYRTLPDRDNTTIMGSSMGGLISLYAISEYPDTFGAAGMVSTHWPIADGMLVDYFSERLPDPDTHRLYFDFGTNTLDWNYEAYQDRMDAAVEAAGYVRSENWTTRKYDGQDHSERSWRSRVHVPLKFLLEGENIDGGERR
ncbi:alpha/beta hydrolase [Algimonas porphyrae]